MTNTDLHAVFAYTNQGNRYRVSTPDLTYGDAIAMWQRVDERLRYQNAKGEPSRVNGEQIDFLNVRSMDDENWNTAPKMSLTWGYVASDDGRRAGFTREVDAAIKGLKGGMLDVLSGTSAAMQGRIYYDTHAKTREGLANRGLVRSEWDPALTPLGHAVALRLFKQATGMTPDEYKQNEANKKRAATIKRNAMLVNYKKRVAAMQPTLAGLTFSGKDAMKRLTDESHEFASPMYKHNPKGMKGKVTMTVAELEALIQRASER